MGCFSWCTSDTKKSIPCCIPFGDLPGTVYLLNPFGEPYKETGYDGYGEFGGRDVYELVVEWNREFLTPDNITKPDRSSWAPGDEGSRYFAKAMAEYNVACEAIKAYAGGASDEFMRENYGAALGYAGYANDWKRCLGIKIACYDKDHVKLKYPIKIVEKAVPYEQAGMSPACPFQGCIYPDSMREIRRDVRKVFADLAMAEEKWKDAQEKKSLAEQIQDASYGDGKEIKDSVAKDGREVPGR